MCEYFHFIDEETNGGSKMLASGRGKTQTQIHSTVELFVLSVLRLLSQSSLFKENGLIMVSYI